MGLSYKNIKHANSNRQCVVFDIARVYFFSFFLSPRSPINLLINEYMVDGATPQPLFFPPGSKKEPRMVNLIQVLWPQSRLHIR